MGQFSWITQDTQKSISNTYPTPVTMTDNKGNKWTEEHYEGYGIFQGKDFYELVVEMNPSFLDNPEALKMMNTPFKKEIRDIGICIVFGDKPFLSPNLNENSEIKWTNSKPQDCPNQGWT
tara:strand:+ start:96 stop:455 length:360 start_codon:yes stop_codon:yes gene_type:complete